MPELPEVETIRRTLAPHLAGRTFTQIEVLDPRLLRGLLTKDVFAAALMGRTATQVDRRGKYLLVRLSDQVTWVIHLRMSGRLEWRASEMDAADVRFLRVRLGLDDGSVLDVIDMRRFVTLFLFGPMEDGMPKGLRDLGPEALDPASFTPRYLRERREGRTVTIKGLLLDQRVVAGLGNIYADEALHRARIHPGRQAGTLTEPEVRRLHAAIRAVLKDGIEHLGVSFSLYRDAEGRPGFMSDYLRVYGRAGKPCTTCGETIVRSRVAGRGTALCPRCQPVRPVRSSAAEQGGSPRRPLHVEAHP